jgi:uncharacterized protein YbjT (DUF2867 family)
MILLLGSTGLLGRRILKNALKRELQLRVLVHGTQDWRSSPYASLRTKGVDVLYGDVTNPAHLEKAMTGCDTVINAVGRLHAPNKKDLKVSNIETAEKIVATVNAQNVKRFLHVSCLGASENSASEAMKMKRQAEILVENCSSYWTIFRPSYLFGKTCFLVDLVDPLLRFKPCLAVPGSGMNMIQPVSVNEVAECILQSIYDRESVGKTFKLGGVRPISLLDFMELARTKLRLSGPTFHIPLDVSMGMQNMLAMAVPKQLKGSDAMMLLTTDSVAYENDLETKFGLKSEDFEVFLAALLIKH